MTGKSELSVLDDIFLGEDWEPYHTPTSHLYDEEYFSFTWLSPFVGRCVELSFYVTVSPKGEPILAYIEVPQEKAKLLRAIAARCSDRGFHPQVAQDITKGRFVFSPGALLRYPTLSRHTRSRYYCSSSTEFDWGTNACSWDY